MPIQPRQSYEEFVAEIETLDEQDKRNIAAYQRQVREQHVWPLKWRLLVWAGCFFVGALLACWGLSYVIDAVLARFE
jgi:hypothetical protein